MDSLYAPRSASNAAVLNSEYTVSICTARASTSNVIIPFTSYSSLPMPLALHRQLIWSHVANTPSVCTEGSGGVWNCVSM